MGTTSDYTPNLTCFKLDYRGVSAIPRIPKKTPTRQFETDHYLEQGPLTRQPL